MTDPIVIVREPGPSVTITAPAAPAVSVGSGLLDGTASTPAIDYSVGLETLAVESGAFRWYNRTAAPLFLSRVWASVGIAPTGAAVIVDVHKGGTTVFTNQASRPTIAPSAFESGAVTAIDVQSLAPGEYLTFDVDQVGSSVAGGFLAIHVQFA